MNPSEHGHHNHLHTEHSEGEEATIKNPVHVHCKHCGGPSKYDILKQSYRCVYCGEFTHDEDVRDVNEGWRRLQREKTNAAKLEAVSLLCTACGAELLYPATDGTEKCGFCGGTVVRKEFFEKDNLPDVIVPFVLTIDEARDRLLAWCSANEKHEEANEIKSAIESGTLMGYYLPYRLVKGGVHGEAMRNMETRPFRIGGFLDGEAVNVSKQLNNIDLDHIEPFDWDALVPFHPGYIAGQKVKLNDLSEKDAAQRVEKEVRTRYQAELSQILKEKDTAVDVHVPHIMNMSALLPVYLLRIAGNRHAFVNGQTGKVSVPAKKQPDKPSKRWLIEPTIVTLVMFAALCAMFYPVIGVAAMTTGVLAIMIFAIYASTMRNDTIPPRIVFTGENSKARREGNKLFFTQWKKAATSVGPFFLEEDADGKDHIVTYEFMPFGRRIRFVLEFVSFLFLPAIFAGILYLLGCGEHPPVIQYGAAWYIIAVVALLLYFKIGVRDSVYNHPYVYTEVKGEKRRLQTKRTGSIGILSLFWYGREDASGTNGGLAAIWQSGERGLVYGLLGFLLFLLIGSAFTMIN